MIYNTSGGTSLNFKVVGGTSQPTSPRENTIWINTSTGIASWEFSHTEPATPAEGMVWISTGTSSTVAFNALKKNAIQVCPLSAKQYVGGQWVTVQAKSYQDGEWVDWVTDIVAYDGGAKDISLTYSKATDKGSYIQLTLSANSSTATVKTEAVDLTGLKTLEVKYSSRTGTGELDTFFYAVVWDESGSKEVSKSKAGTTATSGTLTVDISELSGMYRIGFTASNYGSGSGTVRCNSIKALMDDSSAASKAAEYAALIAELSEVYEDADS